MSERNTTRIVENAHQVLLHYEPLEAMLVVATYRAVSNSVHGLSLKLYSANSKVLVAIQRDKECSMGEQTPRRIVQ